MFKLYIIFLIRSAINIKVVEIKIKILYGHTIIAVDYMEVSTPFYLHRGCVLVSINVKVVYMMPGERNVFCIYLFIIKISCNRPCFF